MPWVLTVVVAALLALVALVSLAGLYVERLDPLARWGMTVARGATVVVLFVDVVTLARGHRPDELFTHVGYAIAVVGVPLILLTRQPGPDGEQPDPPHLAVVAVAALAALVLVVRLQQTW